MAEIILDTGPLVALIDKDEQDHDWTVEKFRGISRPVLTCDAVLTETCFLLRELPSAFPQLQKFLNDGVLVSEFVGSSRFGRIFGLMETYRNLPMSFADACLVCMVEDNPGSVLFTLDRDFTVYRQHRRRAIPLIAPF